MRYYNVRNESGRFTKLPKIVNGRLYGYRGTVVRAVAALPNGKRLVTMHKALEGKVADTDLRWIDSRKVAEYLKA